MRLAPAALLGAALCCLLFTAALGGAAGTSDAVHPVRPAGAGAASGSGSGGSAVMRRGLQQAPPQHRPAKQPKRGWLHHDAAAPNLVQQLNKHRVGPNPHTEQQRLLLALVAALAVLSYLGNKYDVCCTTKGNGRRQRVDRARPTGRWHPAP